MQFGHRSGNPLTIGGRRLDSAGRRASSPHRPDEGRATGLRRCSTQVYLRDCRGDSRHTQALNPVPGGFLTTSVAFCPPLVPFGHQFERALPPLSDRLATL